MVIFPIVFVVGVEDFQRARLGGIESISSLVN